MHRRAASRTTDAASNASRAARPEHGQRRIPQRQLLLESNIEMNPVHNRGRNAKRLISRNFPAMLDNRSYVTRQGESRRATELSRLFPAAPGPALAAG